MNMCDQHDNPRPKQGCETPAGQVVSARMITAIVALMAIAVASGSLSAADGIDYRDVRVVESVLYTLRTSSGSTGRPHDTTTKPGPRAMRKAISRLAAATGFLACEGSGLSGRVISHAHRLLDSSVMTQPATQVGWRLCGSLFRMRAAGRSAGTFGGRAPGALAAYLAHHLNLPPPG